MPKAPPTWNPYGAKAKAGRAWSSKPAGDDKRTRGSRWMKIRAAVLAEEPYCRVCKEAGRSTFATQVDHIRGISEGGTDERKNLRGVCVDCHMQLTKLQARRARGLGPPPPETH